MATKRKEEERKLVLGTGVIFNYKPSKLELMSKGRDIVKWEQKNKHRYLVQRYTMHQVPNLGKAKQPIRANLSCGANCRFDTFS